MSTKIYNGIKFASDDLRSVHAALVAAGPELRSAAAQLQRRDILTRAGADYDRCLRRGIPPTETLSRAADEFFSEIEQSRRNQGAAFRYCLSVVVMPHQTGIYGMAFGAASLIDRLNQAVPFTEFHYQNQTDQPESISDSEWSMREAIWGEIFAPSPGWIPSEVGFDFQVAYGYEARACRWAEYAGDLDQVGPDRLWNIVDEQIEEMAILGEMKVIAGIEGVEENPKTFAPHMRAKSAVRQWLKSDEGQAFRLARRANLCEVLPAQITIEMLTA